VPPGALTVITWCAAVAFGAVLVATLPVAGHFVPHLFGGLVRGPLVVLAAAVVLALPIGLLRRRPLLVFAILVAESLVFAIMVHNSEIAVLQFLAAGIAVCFIAATCPRRVSIGAAVTALSVLAGYSVVRLADHAALGTASVAALALTVVIAWVAGYSIGQRRDYAESLRAQAAAQAIVAERLRIARELHDMVAHSIGIIAIQAGMGSRVIDTQPSEARNALSAIETTSRETLAGLRRMLGALRQADSGLMPADPTVSAPAPGLADLDRLAEATSDAGVHVDVTWRGDRRPLPADIDLSAFRIIQEAITNVVRHASTPNCRVSVHYRDEDLSIEVVDDGTGGTTAGTGYGIAGMRERVGLLHGDFMAGPRPEGGFRVAARLPR
jgi:signal transduction histidine kinase